MGIVADFAIGTLSNMSDAVVSNPNDLLIRVNSADEPLGTVGKLAAHVGAGVLHRAISVFVFNSAGEILLQQRHASKQLWGGFWSNSCCSHPFPDEEPVAAGRRRTQEELGIVVELEFLFKFEYQARFNAEHSEHELCWVFVGETDSEPEPNRTEIQDWKWCTPEWLDAAITDRHSNLTPWSRLEWERIRTDSSLVKGVWNA